MTFATSQSAAPEFISLDDIEVVSQSEWLAALTEAGSTDTYMQLGYHRASAALEPCPAYPVLVRARMGDACVVLPLLVRPLPDGNGFDATSAYGYGGVIASAPFDGEAFGAQFDAWARANTIIATFLRSHPLLENHEAVPPQAHDIALGATVAWQLDPDKALLESMHSHHRRAVRKADRAGVEVSVEVASHASLARFRVLYDETMRRQEAASC
jgi:hypothetical protein